MTWSRYAGRVMAVAGLCVAGSASAQLGFSDQTDAVGLTASQMQGDFEGMIRMMAGGGAVGDFNNDGWPDLYFCVGGGEPDKLFINQGSGPMWFVDEAASWGVGVANRSVAAYVGDYNNDGWQDIFVVSQGDMSAPRAPGKHKLYRNNGDNTFTEVAAAAGVNSGSSVIDGTGAAWGDFDLDGDLDLYIGSWFEDTADGNRLFRNEGDGTFRDVTNRHFGTSLVGLRSFTPKFADMTGDRYPELLLANDWETSRLFLSERRGRRFTDITASAGITEDCNGMGSTIADLDGDGDLDWYITNIFRDPFGTPFCGNTLYNNQGGGTSYVDTAATVGAWDGGFGWGIQAIDLDNDTDLDLVETSGMMDYVRNIPSRVWLYRANTSDFFEWSGESGLVHQDNGRGLVHMDYDKDGDVDVLFFSNENGGTGALKLFRNDLVHNQNTNWFRLNLDTSMHPCLAPMGYHTSVTARVGTLSLVRYADGSSTCFSQGEMTMHFGLRRKTQVDRLIINWADGSRTVLDDVPGNQELTVTAWHPADIDRDGDVDTDDQNAYMALYGVQDPDADMDGDGDVDTDDLAMFMDMLNNPCG